MAVLPPTFLKGFHDEQAVQRMDYTSLGVTGLQVSKLGLGGGAFGSLYGHIKELEVKKVVEAALKSGINYIDTAPWYGFSKGEIMLGKALQGIPRESYYIGTKVGRYEEAWDKMFDFSYKRTCESVDESLSRLGLSYVDIIQVHDLEFAPSLDIIFEETLPALQDVVKAGKARFIGITGYPLYVLKDVIERSNTHIDTVLSYCRNNLYDSSLQDFIPIFQAQNVGVINAAPTAMGLLSALGPPVWHPAPQIIQDVCKQANTFCESEGVLLAKLAVHHTLQQPGICCNLVSCHSIDVLNQNLNTLYNGLSDQEEWVLQQVCARYMSQLKVRHWEDIEVEKYQKKLIK